MSIKIDHKFLFAVLLVTCPAFAADGEAAPASGGEKVIQKNEKTPAEEFTEKASKLSVLQNRIMSAQSSFDQLVEEKDKEKDQKRKEEMIKQLVEISKSRNKDVEEYNRLRNQVLYQYPAKSAELNRLYQGEDKKNLDEMQSTADLDDLLTRIKKVIVKKFAAINPENDQPKPRDKAVSKGPTSGGEDGKNKEDQPPKLRLEK